MCGTYTLRKSPEEVYRLIQGDWLEAAIPLDAWNPSYKIKPSQHVPIVTADDAPTLRLAKWGFAPTWMADPRRMQINARIETAAVKPMFRSAYQANRCLVLADGFYEPEGTSQPRPWRFFQLPDEELCAFAGICTPRAVEGEAVLTFAILTCPADEVVRPAHDRMPVMLRMHQWDGWLNSAFVDFDATAPQLDSWQVGDDAKKASAFDGPNCLERRLL